MVAVVKKKTRPQISNKDNAGIELQADDEVLN
jgi:hypothetical protein